MAALLVALRVAIFGTGFHEPTSKDPVGSLTISVDGTPGELIVEFDQATGWTSVTDNRQPGLMLFIHGSEVIVQSGHGNELVSLPSSSLFPSTLSLAPTVLATSLDRGPRECTSASPDERELLDYFFGSRRAADQYGIRGRTTFVDQTGHCPTHAADATLERLTLPDMDRAVPAAEMDDGGAAFMSTVIDPLSRYWAVLQPDR